MTTLKAADAQIPLTSEGGSGRPGPARTLAARIASDRRGDVAIIFGVMGFTMMLIVGGAVDFGRWLNARADTVKALDAAVLAGGRSLQLNNNEAAAVDVAKRYYLDNVKHRLPLFSDDIGFAVTDGGTTFSAQGSAYIATPFMSWSGVDKLPLLNLQGTDYSKAKLAVGGNSKTHIEIGMMLDVSGSMSGDKLSDMKKAAKDLIDIIVWDDQSSYTSKVAIVPFSGDINLPSDLLNASRDPAMVGPFTGPSYSCKISGSWNTCKDDYTRRDCVVERKGDQKYTDAGPGAGSYVMSLFMTKNDKCSTPSASSVMPLSNNKTALKAKIDGLVIGGGTAGHLGTAWAWYMISPNWASVLPEASKPKSYGTSNLKKIAILMTDGEYNAQYSTYGIKSGTKNAPTPNGAVNGSSVTQAKAICDGMRAADIEVYTVGFDLGGNSTAISTLNYCATDPGNAYLAEDGEALRQAFRDIALKISTLYLAH